MVPTSVLIGVSSIIRTHLRVKLIIILCSFRGLQFYVFRSARSCRSPLQPTMHTRRSAVICCACRRERAATLHVGSRCGACSTPTTAYTVRARSGGSCNARGSTLRYTVARVMRAMRLAGGIRDKRVRTTISDRSAPCLRDRVNRQFRASAPDMLWVSDFT
jgi:hypothetical protein